jgi:adenylate cyclase/guanylate cyclase
VLNAIVDGGAKVVGFELVIPTSIEQSEIPFAEGMLGEKVRGFDRDFLRALATAAAPGKVVLGEQLRGNDPIRPSPGQRVAVRQQQNIRPLNTITDGDDIVRRMPLSFTVNNAKVPGMALELAARAQNATPEFAADGSVTLAGYKVPSAVPNTMTVNFEAGADDIPTSPCRPARLCGRTTGLFQARLRRQGLLFGTVLERRTTASSDASPPARGARARCAGEGKPVLTSFKRSQIAASISRHRVNNRSAMTRWSNSAHATLRHRGAGGGARRRGALLFAWSRGRRAFSCSPSSASPTPSSRSNTAIIPSSSHFLPGFARWCSPSAIA